MSNFKNNKYLVALVFTILVGVVGVYYESSKIKIDDKLLGNGDGVKNGQTVIFDYRAYLYDEKSQSGLGIEFDSSYRRNSAMTLVLGKGQFIPGVEKGILGMKTGGQRYLKLKPSMAYGEIGAGGGLVPPNSTLVYFIELRAIQ